MEGLIIGVVALVFICWFYCECSTQHRITKQMKEIQKDNHRILADEINRQYGKELIKK